jgi:steroid 5-alpha reductase family enzyme
MAQLIPFLVESAIIVFVFMNLFFLLSLKFKRNDIADSAWGLGFVILSVYHLIRSGLFLQTKLIITFLVILWGIRLFWYITLRNKGKSEDFRYKNWREKWGKSVILKSYLQVYILQGFFMILIALPVTLYNRFAGGVWFWGFVGILIWIIGFYFETASDLQMYSFKKDKKNIGRIMKYGLWKYSRHPNYFGEVTMWWGIWVLTIGANYWYIGLLGPLTITFLILKVSGIPMLEKKYEGNKEYEKYKKATSAFIPWFPKS